MERYVVLDTAPTGHTLLLLDTAGAYHREVMRSTGRLRKPIAGRVITPLLRLQDPDFTRLLIVTLPEATPISEAAQLQEDLRRAGIEPYGWVVNGSLAASGTKDPLLSRRAHLEVPHLRRVAELAARVWVVPWCPDGPRGVEELAARPQPSRPVG